MTCSACGSALTPEARFCPRCGVALTPPGAAPAYAQPPAAGYAPGYAPTYAPGYGSGVPPYPVRPYDRVRRHLPAIAICWLVYAAVRAVSGFVGLVLVHGFFASHFGDGDVNLGWNPFHAAFLHLWPLGLFTLSVSVLCILLTGFALLTRQSWGRIFAIIFSIFALIHLPFGTALGIYTLWVLAPGASGVEYDALSDAEHRG